MSRLDFRTYGFLSSKFKCANIMYVNIDTHTCIYIKALSAWVSISLLFDLPLRSSKLNSKGQFPILLAMVMVDHTFWYTSLEALMMQRFVMGFTYLTTHKPQVQWSLKTWHCSEKAKTINGNMILTLEGSKWWSKTTLSKVYKNECCPWLLLRH